MAKSYPTAIPCQFASDNLADAYRSGWNHGHGIACHNVPEIGARMFIDGEGRVTIDEDNIRDMHASLCHLAADNSRSYSPFEFTAAEFNRSEDHEELWEAFESGTADAIAADLSEYTDEDYGIEAIEE